MNNPYSLNQDKGGPDLGHTARSVGGSRLNLTGPSQTLSPTASPGSESLRTPGPGLSIRFTRSTSNTGSHLKGRTNLIDFGLTSFTTPSTKIRHTQPKLLNSGLKYAPSKNLGLASDCNDAGSSHSTTAPKAEVVGADIFLLDKNSCGVFEEP